MPIKVLDRHTINQIAAGEVIERPSSALKELLENSADSGALRIEIDFEAGGKKEIKVVDDGHGISPEDLLLALEPHATSKITQIDDLSRLRTFGFRGEALASISAVSELTLHSSVREASMGASVHCKGGSLSEVIPAPAIKGTKISIKDLFYNVPARQKFLKSDGGETAAVKKVIRYFALGHPEITVTARQQGRPLYHFEKESFFKRAARVLDLKTEDLISIQVEERHIRLEVAAALPSKNLATQQGIWIFVQGRPVVDRTILQAIFEGYRNLLMQHQFPQVVLSLWVDPSEVDVNVHPTKAQVKFTDNSLIFRFVSHTLKKALEERFNVERFNAEKFGAESFGGKSNFGSELSSFGPAENLSLLHSVATQYNQRVDGAAAFDSSMGQGALQFHAPGSTGVDSKFLDNSAFENSAVADSAAASSAVMSPSILNSAGETSPVQSSPFHPLATTNLGIWSSLHVIGQAANTYIVCQSPKAVILIDQHAAHERVLFEKIKKESGQSQVETQRALFEELLELDRESIEILTEPRFSKLFKNLGFEFIDRGPTTLAVTTRPAFLIEVSLQPIIERIAEQLIEMGAAGILDDLITDIWATMSCHGAIRAGRSLSHNEMKSLLVQMDEFAFSSFCPHGRPVTVQWTLRDLEKLFKRIV